MKIMLQFTSKRFIVKITFSNYLKRNKSKMQNKIFAEISLMKKLSHPFIASLITI